MDLIAVRAAVTVIVALPQRALSATLSRVNAPACQARRTAIVTSVSRDIGTTQPLDVKVWRDLYYYLDR